MIKPRGLAEVFQAIPAGKIIELAKAPSTDFVLLVGKIAGDPPAKAQTCLRQADIVEIADNVCIFAISGMAGKLATQS